jgi:hypothetical protein
LSQKKTLDPIQIVCPDWHPKIGTNASLSSPHGNWPGHEKGLSGGEPVLGRNQDLSFSEKNRMLQKKHKVIHVSKKML